MNGKQLKNSILQWAIQGRLVPQDPNDEPASVLLQRIQAEKQQLVAEGKLKPKDLTASTITRTDDNHYLETITTGTGKKASSVTADITEQIPFDIPASWQWVRLGDVVQVNPKNNANDDVDAAFIPMELIDATYLSSFTFQTKKWKTIKNGFTHFANGDVAFAKITPCFQNRKSMILHDLPNGIGAGTTELKVLRTIGKTIIDYYLLFFLKSSYFIEQAVFKGTANQQRIITGYLENKLFPLPPLAEQQRIVDKIEQLMPIINQYAAAQDKLDALNNSIKPLLRKSILQEAIQGHLVPQVASEGSAAELLARIQAEKQQLVADGKLKPKDLTVSTITRTDDNHYLESITTGTGKKASSVTADITEQIPFDIPASWQWVRLSFLCNIVNGFTPLRTETKFWKNGTVNWFTVEDIRKQGEEIKYTEQKITEEATTKDRIVRAGSTLLCCTASVGQCAITRVPVTTNQQFNALSVKKEFTSICDDNYLFQFTKTLAPLLHQVAGQTTFEFISVKKVGNILIPLPPLAEQQRIVQQIETLFAKL